MRIDGFLSRKAQEADSTALVYVLEEADPEAKPSRKAKVDEKLGVRKNFILRFNNNTEEIGLGDSFKFANQGVDAWVNSKRKFKKEEADNE